MSRCFVVGDESVEGKMKMKNVALRVRLMVFAIGLLAFVLPASAAKRTYYAKLTVTADAGGRVWANTSKNATGAVYAESFQVSNSKSSSSSSASVQFYAYAKGNKGYKFNKWTAGSGSGAKLGTGADTTAAGASVTISSSSTKNNSPTEGSASASFTQGEIKVTAGDPVEIELGDAAVLPTFTVAMTSGSASDYGLVDGDFTTEYSTDGTTWQSEAQFLNGRFTTAGTYTVHCRVSAGEAKSGTAQQTLTVQRKRISIDMPTATTAFTFDNTAKTCVAAGDCYTRGGTYEATNAGDYTATVTPDADHCWTGGSRAPVEIKWSIARRPVTVTVVNTNKVEGAVFFDPDQQMYNDPIWTTKTEGLIAGDAAELTWDIFRTNACEGVGTYDLLVEGEKKQGNYDLAFVGGKYEICEAPPPGPKVVPVTDLDQPIVGVEPGEVRIVSGSGVDITAAFTLTGSVAEGVTATLNPSASVTVGEGAAAETIAVVPELTESGDKAVEPFEVVGDQVDVGVKTIPGLTYNLRRSETVVTVSKGDVVDSKRAETTRTRLTDPFEGGKPPKAFYMIETTK